MSGDKEMERRLIHTPTFTALVLILTLTLSLIYIPIVGSQDSAKIISKLRELHGDVSALPLDEAFENTHAAKGQRKALMNKINATIHQIKAGAYEGAVKKLENDLKNTIEAWITEDYERNLIDKVDEIIKLIKGELPPPSPDFSLKASPTSLTIAQGKSDISIITVTSLNGFSKLVDLTVSDVPLRVATILSPEQVTPPADGTKTSTLTVLVDLSATPDIYVLTVTGASNSRRHSIGITLEITELPPQPDFSIKANPPLLTIEQDNSDTSIITVTSISGFNQPVDLAVTSTPISGVTSSLDPVQVTPSAGGSITSTLTVHVDNSATPGMYTLTVTGTSDGLLHSADIELEITTAPPSPDFSITVHPFSLSIRQDASDTADITIASLNGFSDLVTVTVSPAIDGVTYSLDPSAVTPPADGTITSTLTIAVAETATPNTYVLAITGTSGALQRSASLSLKITKAPLPPDVEPPTVRIDEPTNGSYLSGQVKIVVFMYDENFKKAELTINNKRIASWTTGNVSLQGIEHPISWSTTLPEYLDGVYNITLTAEDEAENDSEETLIVTVDNTKPTAIINAPEEESYLGGSILIRVTGEDKNFYKMNLKIDNVSVKNWTTGGSQIYEWNTEVDGIDGAHTITLIVFDKAENSDESSVTVFVDNTLPTIRVDEPVEGSYLAGTVDVRVFIQEDNLDKVELTINFTGVVSWTLSGEHVFNWDTTTYAEGIYFIKLSALDKAGNIGEETVKVTVDNTMPTALIQAPTEGSYLKGTVSINVTGDDINFDRMELGIGDVLAKTWTTGGDKLFSWDTSAYSDGTYNVTLTVYDKANNSREVYVTVTLDNTPPIIEAATWSPKEPSTDEQVNVTVKVNDPQPGSGIQNVTLWYNTTIDDWQSVPMNLNATSGNWTATIPAQSAETTIRFYIEAFDNAGNKAESDEIYEYDVIVPIGIPLAWIVAIILLILAATVAAIYFWRRRRREKQGSAVVLCF